MDNKINSVNDTVKIYVLSFIVEFSNSKRNSGILNVNPIIKKGLVISLL